LPYSKKEMRSLVKPSIDMIMDYLDKQLKEEKITEDDGENE